MHLSSRVRLGAAALVSFAVVWGPAQGSEVGVSVGEPAPAFELAAASGGTVSLDDYAGGTLAVVFYRTGA